MYPRNIADANKNTKQTKANTHAANYAKQAHRKQRNNMENFNKNMEKWLYSINTTREPPTHLNPPSHQPS